jgi:hypothetical protein
VVAAVTGFCRELRVEAITRFSLSRRQQFSRIIRVSARILDRGLVLFVYFAGGSTLRRCPYISSSTYDTQLNSNNCMFFSIRRYSGMLIFQGRV